MFDYTNNFPIIESQPEAGRLRFNAFIQTPEFLDSMQGVGKVADVNRWNDPTAWTTLGEDRESEVTSDEYRNGVKVLMASEGEFRGFLEDFAGFLGIDAFKDESKAKVVRGVFAGYDPNKPIQFRKSELTPEALKVASENMQLLMEAEKDKPVDPKNLTPNQKRIQEYAEKLIYAKSGEVAKTQLGFSPKGFLTDVAGDPLIDLVTNATGNDPADLSDVIELQTKIDPSFDSTAWFDKMTEDQTVKMGLLEYGISASTVAGAPNEDAARFLIGRQLAKNEIQERIARYSPTFMDEANILGTSALNDPDFIPGIALEVALIGAEVGLGVATGGASALATVPLRLGRGVALASKARSLLHAPGLINDFVRLKNVFGASRTIAITKGTLETMAKLPLGMAPSYAKKLKLIGQVGAPFAIGATAGVLTESFRQKSEIAYAAATLYSDPDAQREYDYEAIAWAGGASGLFGATLFGLAPVLIGAGFGASLNRLKGLNLSKYGEEVIRDEFNKQWSLKGTMLGESLDSIPGIRKKTKTVIDGPVDEVAATKAELTGKPTSGEGIMADTTERVDRAETRAIDSPEKAETLPVENASKRYDNETKESYVTRVASNKLVTDIVSFVRELSKFVPDTADNLVLSSYDWTKMTAKDQIKALADSADWIKKAKEIESKSSGGLALDRAKVYDVMEQQRRKYIRNLAKTMTKDEYKALQKEMRGDRRVALPEALAAARRTSATTKEKQEAASEVAAQLIERAKEIAKDRDKAVRTREEVPAEVLKSFDAATTEASLTGRVSEETAAAIRANVMGVEPKAPRFSMVRQAIDNALLRKRLNPERMEKIRAVVENPRRFIELVEGNKESARNFYNFVTQMRQKGLISADQRDLLLAATVHLNFDNRAFNITYTFGVLGKNVVGQYDRKSNTLTMSTVWTGDMERRARTVLHELGHAFVSHKAKGDLYLDMLKLYNTPSSDLSFNFSNIHAVDSMLRADFLSPYHLSNIEETFVQTFSEVLFKESRIAVGSLDPVKVSLLQNILNDIAESLVVAAEALNMSKYYKVANELIDEIVKVNNLLDDSVSVPHFVTKFASSVVGASSVKEANARLSRELQTNKYRIEADEWDLVSKMVESDPSFLVAYAVLKTQGKSLKSQADYDFLVGAYAEYKTAQFNSLLYRVSFAISTEAEFFRKKTKEDRLAFIENYFFDVVDDKKMGILNIQSTELPTYEDRVLNSLPSVETNDNYGRSYWLTTGNALRAELESRGINTDRFDRNTMLSKSVLENVQTHLSSLGLEEVANSLINVYHKRLIRNMADGILNVEPSVNVIDTPAFKTWFSNSVVIDSDGKPLVMYHGTPSGGFNIFDLGVSPTFGLFGAGFYFTENAKVASSYALKNKSDGLRSSVYPVYINIKNPIDMDKKVDVDFWLSAIKNYDITKRTIKDLENYISDDFILSVNTELKTLVNTLESSLDADSTNEAAFKLLEDTIKSYIDDGEEVAPYLMLDILKQTKVDGITHIGGGRVKQGSVRHRVYIAFEPTQIKSVNNRGTFDPTNPDIRFNVELPSWSSADIAKSALADMLQQKVDLPTVIAMLSRQVEPVLLQNLINLVDKVDLTPEKKTEDLLTGLYKAINDGAFHYNPTTGKWQSEIFKAPRKPKAKKTVTAARPEKPAEAKPVEEVQAEAGAADVVTPDNYVDHLTKIAQDLDRGLNTTASEQQAIVVISNILLNENHSIIKMIMDGKITNTVDLRKVLIKQGKNIFTDEGREYRRITVTDPVTGKKSTKKVLVQQGETAEGKVKEGTPVKGMERIEQDGLERENTKALIERIESILQYIPDFITSNERILLDGYRQSPIQAKVAEIIGKSKATVSTWDTKLKAKLARLFKEADIDAEVLRNPEQLQKALLAWDKKQKEAAASAIKSKPSKKKVVEAETKEPAKVDPDPAEKGKRMAELAAKAAKLKNDNPTPVPTPVTTTEPTMARVTSEVTGNAPEEVLRPEKQADALIDGDVSATKELVTFTPKKPLQTTFNSSVELEANPEKMKSLMEAAARAGRDAIVFKDGSMIPVKAEPVVVGRTELRKPVGIETVTTVTVEKGVPVKRVAPKPKKSKVKGDGEPVRVTTKGEPKKPEPKVRESDVVKTEESERIERLVNEQKDTARSNGLDSSFLKQLLSVYWKAMKELDKDSGVPYTPMFMRAWTKFVVINKEIMEANLKLVGKDGVAKFWDKVDQLRAIEQVKKVTVPGYTPRTDKAIFAEAAAEVSPKFIPFVTPRSLKLKAVDGDIVFTSKDKMIRSIVAENKTESPVPTPPTPAAAVSEEVPMSIKMPDTDDAELKEMDSILQEAIDTAENNASMPLRQSSLIGVIFGGSNRDSASFWERLMNWMVNTSQTASATGLTIRSMQHSIRFVSRLFDDTRAQTGHLAAAGKTAFKTAMQLKSDEKATINRIAKYQLRINKYLENLPTERNKLMLTIYRKLANGENIVEADIRAAGITDTGLITTLTKNSNELLKVVRQVNETILGLEAETGMVRSVDSMGNTIEAERFAPVQLNHEYISRLSPEQRKILVAKLIEARTQRKLESKILDINTLIAMGWLDVAPSADSRGTNIFAGDRKFRSGLGINTISQETKNKLRTGITYPIGADPNNILVDLANKGMPQEFFVLRENNVLNVYRMPKVIDDLGESDLIRYREAITGNTAMYHPRWKEYLKNKNLVEVEMEETLDFKTKSGKYSEFNSKTSSNIDRPLLRLGSDESIALAVPGLTPEEVLRFPEITAAMRTNLAESYFYFLNGRMFELLFQKELDRLLGRTGITPINLFDWLYKFNEENLNKLAKAENWTPNQLIARKQELALGVDRLREEYAINADTLPTIPNKQLYTARAGLAIMKMKVAPGYILSTMTEVLQEFLKSNPIELPANIINGIRHIFGDLRLSKSKLLEQDIGDLAFVADSVLRAETGDRLLGEVSHGAFELDNKLKTKFINSNTPMNRIDRTTMMLETGARVAESIGSLNAVTNWVRGMALTRWQRRVWDHISKNRIQKLLDVMETPNMRQLMDQLLIASQSDAIAERKLWKQFAAEARKAGFGFEPQEAMIFFRYGLNSKEKIRHLKYLIENSNSDRSGRVNINSMVDTYWREKRNPTNGIDPRILGDVLSAYRFMLDDLVIKTSSPEPTGLGRITRIDAKTSFGKLWYALTSWIRGYQDSVVLNYATQNTMQYLAKTIILFGTLDTITGLFREWVAGRETEDMVEEFTNSPSSFAIRVMKAAPIMGSANAVVEGLLSGLSYLSGGSWRYYGSPMSSIGVNAAGSATKDIFGGLTEIATQTSNAFSGTEEVEGPKVAKAIGDITMFNSLFNRSPVAVPARFIEDMEALDQKGAVQKYMNLIQREPYPYAKAQRKGPAGAPKGVTIAPEPRNLAKEQAQFAEARKKQEQLTAGIRPVSMSINDQKGVSGALGDILGRAE